MACRCFVLATLAFALSGCELDYYLHLASGQTRLLLDCEPVEDLLGDPTLEARTRDRLLFVEAVRSYAHGELKLAGGQQSVCPS